MKDLRTQKYSFVRLLRRPEGLFLLAAFIVMPLLSGMALYQHGKSQLRGELAELCQSLPPILPLDHYLHLIDRNNATLAMREPILQPLTMVHRTNPKIQYIYTLRGNGNNWMFLLDTLQDPDTREIVQRRYPHSVASGWKEAYEYPTSFLKSAEVLRRGETWVDSRVFVDDYGSTIGCIIPLHSSGDVIDVLGVDYRADELTGMKHAVTAGVVYGATIGLLLFAASQAYLRSYMNVKQQLLQHFHHESNTDSLTGISNRRWFFESAERLFAQRGSDTVVSAAIIDIDLFKDINDNYGHEAGDEALRVFSRLLDKYCNPRKFIIGRIGGEEFAVCCATRYCDDMIDSLSSLQAALKTVTIDSDKGTFSFTFSAGLVSSKSLSADLHELMRKADEALYESKDSGRDRITFFVEHAEEAAYGGCVPH